MPELSQVAIPARVSLWLWQIAMSLNIGNKSYAKPNSAHSDLQDDVMAYWRAKSPGWIPGKELDLGSRSMDKEVKRADVFVMSETYPPRFIICEVKVGRADFLKDIKSEKYVHYMENCNLFYFVTPSEMVTWEDVPPWCGWLEQRKDRKWFDENITGDPNPGFKMPEEIWHSFAKRLGG